MKKVLIALLLVCWSAANATTYYISPSGNDITGTGTALNPWKTLYKATSTVPADAGHIIHVNAGTYIETQICELPTGVSIQGDGVTSIIKASYSAVYDPIISGYSNIQGTNGNQRISYLKFDGQNSTSWCMQIQGRSNVEVDHNTFISFKQRGVVMGGLDDNGDEEPSIYATGNSFHDNIMTNCSGWNDAVGPNTIYGCLNIGGQRGMVVYNNTIINNNIAGGGPSDRPGEPIKLWNDGYLDSVQIFNNVLKRPPFPYQYDGINGYFGFAIEFFNQRGLHIYNNTIEGSIDLNYQTKGPYPYSVWIHDNVIGRDATAAHGETAVWLEYETEDAIIEDNTFKNVSQCIAFSLRPDIGKNFIRNITIRRNLGYGIGKTDATREGGATIFLMNDNSQSYTSQGYFNMYNNTWIASTATNAAPNIGVELPGGTSATNVHVRNNIIQGFNDYAINSEKGNSITGAIITNNQLYLNQNSNTFQWQVGNPVSSTLTPNPIGNPNLDGSYHPNVGSVVIDAGVNVSLPFNGSAPDIGFYETGSSNTSPVANAGSNQSITLPVSSVNLSGSGSDADGTVSSYSWVKVSGPVTYTIVSPTLAATSVTGLVAGMYNFELTVTDNLGATGKDTVQVTVNAAVNVPPVANAGPDQAIVLPTSSVTMAGSATDADGTITSKTWTQVSGTTATITTASSYTTTITGMATAGVRVFRLTVVDNNGASHTDDVTITVTSAVTPQTYYFKAHKKVIRN